MPVKNYVSRNGQVEYEYDDLGDILTYGRDALGNVVAGYDAATNAVFTADYKPYGEFAATTGSVAGRRFMWVGSWGYRFTSGVPVSHYIRARHLSMRMGMWTSVDPLWPSEPAFGYVGGMPTAFIDPLGLQSNRPPRQVGPPSRPNPGRGGRPRRGRGHPTTSPTGPAGKCKLVRCEIHGWNNWIATHVRFCIQTGNPNKSCTSEIYHDSRTGNVSTSQNCRQWALNEISKNVNCFEKELDCRLASLACQCVEEQVRQPFGLWHYVDVGTCYHQAKNLLNCACDKLTKLDRAHAVAAGCKNSKFDGSGPPGPSLRVK